MRASVSAGAYVVYAVFTFSAFGAEVAFSSDAVKANSTSAADLVVSAVFALFAAVGTYRSALSTTVTAGAHRSNAVYAFTAFFTKQFFATDASNAQSASAADLVVSTVFAYFTAVGAYQCTVRAAVSAVADLLDTVFTYSAFGAVRAFATCTIPADAAVSAELIVGAVFTFLAALRAHHGAV